MIFLLPETSRSIVGNGSLKPPKHLRLPMTTLMCHWKDRDPAANHKWRMPNPLKSLTILVRRDNAIIIIACGLLYVVYTCINISLSVLFIDIYKLNQWQAGLIYLPFGIGGTASTFFSGPLLDKAYRNARTERGLSTDKAVGDDLDNFPIEKARLGVVWIPMLVTSCSVVAFGWVLHYHQVCISSENSDSLPADKLHLLAYGHPAFPSIHCRIVHATRFQRESSPIFPFVEPKAMDLEIYNTLLVDKNYRSPAAAQAASNMVRCSLAAIAVSFLQHAIDAMGIGWTFTLMGGLCLIALCLFFIDYHRGTLWRQRSLASLSSQESGLGTP